MEVLLVSSWLQKPVKSAKGAQSLFLDLVPAISMTPMGKRHAAEDSSRGFASQEAVTALAETLAKRDAEVSKHAYLPCRRVVIVSLHDSDTAWSFGMQLISQAAALRS